MAALAARGRSSINYTQDLTPHDFQRLFTRDTREAYRYFTRAHRRRQAGAPSRGTAAGRSHAAAGLHRLHDAAVAGAPRAVCVWRRRRCSSACCSCSAASAPVKVLLVSVLGVRVPAPAVGRRARCGCSSAFALINLLVLMEVADRLSLKGDLEIARDIQLAMLPGGLHQRGRRRRLRRDAAGEHRRRRLLRHPAAARRPAGPRARRRRRQGQSRPRC